MKKYKILYLIKSLGRGGAEMLLASNSRYHNATQFDFYCIYFLSWKNQVVKELQQAGIRVICFPSSNNIQILLQRKKLVRFIKEHQIDLIHAHLPWAGIIGAQVARKGSLPIIYTEHNNVTRYHYITKWLNGQSYSNYSQVIAVSNDCRKAAIDQFKSTIPCPIKTIYNGVNTDEFVLDESFRNLFRKQLGINEEVLVITNVAQYREQKRLDRWLSIVKQFSDLEPTVRFILIGFGPKQQLVDELIKKYHLEGKLLCPGLQHNVKDWLSITDILLMSSDWEGLPIALLEAMSMGCVPVVTDAGGVPEVMTEECGFMYEKENEQAAVHALRQLFHNPELRNRMSLAARNRVVNHFNVKRMVQEVEDTYKEVLGQYGL